MKLLPLQLNYRHNLQLSGTFAKSNKKEDDQMSSVLTVISIQAEFLKALQTLVQQEEELEHFVVSNLTNKCIQQSRNQKSRDVICTICGEPGHYARGVPPISFLRQCREKLL